MNTAKPRILDQDFLSHNELASNLNMTPGSLSAAKCAGHINLPEYKIGRRKYYKISDVRSYLETLRREPA
jgi:hypothetical protein